MITTPPQPTNEYSIDFSPYSQGEGCHLAVDLIIKPPIELGDKIGDFLYGERGEVEFNTLSQHEDFTHVELRTSPRTGRPVREVAIVLGRLAQYLEADSDPMEYKRIRQLPTVREEAEHERRSSK